MQAITPQYSSNLVSLSVTIHDANAAIKFFELFDNIPNLKFLQTNFLYKASITTNLLTTSFRKQLYGGVYDLNQVFRLAKKYLQSNNAYLLPRSEMQTLLEKFDMGDARFSQIDLCDLIEVIKFPMRIVERYTSQEPMDDPFGSKYFIPGTNPVELLKGIDSERYTKYLKLEALHYQALFQQFFKCLAGLQTLQEVSIHGEVTSLESSWLGRLIHISQTLKRLFSSAVDTASATRTVHTAKYSTQIWQRKGRSICAS